MFREVLEFTSWELRDLRRTDESSICRITFWHIFISFDSINHEKEQIKLFQQSFSGWNYIVGFRDIHNMTASSIPKVHINTSNAWHRIYPDVEQSKGRSFFTNPKLLRASRNIVLIIKT